MNKSSRGFTLPELMVVLAIAAAILAIGAPSFRDFQRNNRLTVAANDVLGMLITSRAEALRRSNNVSMCTSAKPDDLDAACGAGTGWIVFQDDNGDCVRDDGEERIVGLRVDDDVNAETNSDCLSFGSNGYKKVVGDRPTTVHMLYCDDRKNAPRIEGGTESAARGIEITPTGRAAVVKLVDKIDAWGGDDGVECP
jgi:prepilin-type N-terminal cleavage/methylation domain-containing protein